MATINGTSGNDVITDTAEADTINAQAGDDQITVTYGNDTVNGDAGTDTLIIDWRASTSNIITAVGLSANGIGGFDGRYGDSADGNRQVGFTSIEKLDITTGSGNDDIVTGNGNWDDIVTLGAGNDHAKVFAGRDVVHGGTGTDTLVIDWSNANPVLTFELTIGPDGASGRYASGIGDIEAFTVQNDVTFTSIENFDITTGSGGDGVVTGHGDDRLMLNAGDDYAFVRRGTIVADGGAGFDILNADFSEFGSVTIDIRNALNTGAFGSIANFESFEGLTTGVGDDTIITDTLARMSTIHLGAGNDSVTLFNGYDRANGGTGNDTLVLDWRASTFAVQNNGALSDNPDGGYDGFYWFNGFANVAEFTSIEKFTIWSGSANDFLTTGDGDDQVRTGAGNDYIDAAGGNDFLDGGAGDDSMDGGLGNDVYVVDSLGDLVNEGLGQGIDEVRTALGSKAPPDRLVYVLPANVENLTGTAIFAQGVRDNALDNVINMGGGHDLIVADAGGVDTINGGGGNDFIYHGDKLTAADVTNGGAGVDTIGLLGDYGSGITFTATNLVGVERMAMYTSLYLPGTGPNNYNITMHDANVAAGTEFFVTAASLQSDESLTFNGAAETNGRFTVHGGGGADTITGGAGNDFIIGNAGNDLLFGLGGQDFLIGGLGADQLRGGAGGDRFLYQSTAQSTTGNVDRILDFEHTDRIDLSAIDADGIADNGNTSFTFIGEEAFTNTPGQLRVYQERGGWFVEGDVDGDGVADLVILVTLPDATPLGAGDFFL